MTLTIGLIDQCSQRLEEAADQLRDLRINNRTIYEAIDTKIDVERLLRRVIRDMKAGNSKPAVI